jgi:hypothetical protein
MAGVQSLDKKCILYYKYIIFLREFTFHSYKYLKES